MVRRMRAFYNEIDRYCCDWLSNLMDKGHIRPGMISDKSIVDLTPDDVRPYDLAHFFAGIAGWDYALTLAGWRFDGRVTWTGSCPCQPLSSAGQQRGHADERHLWPAFHRLIAECKPAVVFGEQVASKDGREWLAAVRADLERCGYAVGAANLPSAGVGAPHIRQRLWFVADAARGGRSDGGKRDGPSGQHVGVVAGAGGGNGGRSDTARDREAATGDASAVGVRLVADADAQGQRLERRGGLLDGERAAFGDDADGRGAGELGDAESARLQGRGSEQGAAQGRSCGGQSGLPDNPWSDLVWLSCTDGKARPTQPGIFPLAHGATARVGRLRAYGNCITPQVAAEFIKAADAR